jgi:hypothetical protein
MKQLVTVLTIIFTLHTGLQAADYKPSAEGNNQTQELFENDFPENSKKNKRIRIFFKKAAEEIIRPFVPGKFPSFLWSFILSAVGAYTIYGLVLGPISVLVVYLLAKKQKKEVMKSVWGWITGTAVGLGIWILLRVK